MSNVYVSSINYYCYGSHSNGGGTIGIQNDGSTHTFNLDEEAILELKIVADGIVRRQRDKFINKLATLEVMPALTYRDKKDAIEHEEAVEAGPVSEEERAWPDEKASEPAKIDYDF